MVGMGGKKKVSSQQIPVKSHRIIIKIINLTCISVASYAKQITVKKGMNMNNRTEKSKIILKRPLSFNVTKLNR